MEKKHSLIDRKTLYKEVNESIIVYEGDILFKAPTEEKRNVDIIKNGQIIIVFQPYPRIEFVGQLKPDIRFEYFNANAKLDIWIKKNSKKPVKYGKSLCLSTNVIEEAPFYTDKKIKNVNFSLCNLPICNKMESSLSETSGFFIEPRKDLKEIVKKLENTVGSVVTHQGSINFKSLVSHYDAKNHLQTLVDSLRFLSSTHVGIALVEFEHIDETTSLQHSYPPSFKHYEPTPKIIRFANERLLYSSPFFKKIHEVRADLVKSQFLSDIIHWYIEANRNEGMAEGSLVLCRIGIEILFNWLKLKKTKIKTLTSHFKMELNNYQIDHLKRFCEHEGFSSIELGISELRNGFVHPKKDNICWSSYPNFNIVICEAKQVLLSIIDKHVLSIGGLEKEFKHFDRLPKKHIPNKPKKKK
ncbi:MAG: hypothetical protein OXC61_10310 [Flavobacteriaceae bacterium]|nr:hypothetical protein [Flavobacteriaceae bacterium]